MGQTESLKKIRGLRKDIARVKTIARERELAAHRRQRRRSNARDKASPAAQGRRKEVVGEVVSTKMQKTIVVQVIRKRAHPLYRRVVSKPKKFYAHDEKNGPTWATWCGSKSRAR